MNIQIPFVSKSALNTHFVGACVAALLICTLHSTAFGATFTWNQPDGTFGWNVDGNWTTAGFPNANADIADLGQLDITSPTTVNLNQAITVGQLLIGDTNNTLGATYTIAPNGGSLTFNNTGGSGNAKLTQTAGGRGATISANVTLGSDLDVSNMSTTAHQLTLSGTTNLNGQAMNLNVAFGNNTNTGINVGALTGSGAVVKNGNGYAKMTAANANTYSVTINDGTLSYASVSMAGAGDITVNSGGVLDYSSGGNATYGNIISGAGSVTKGLTGTLTLTGSNTYTGNTTVTTGTLVLADDSQTKFVIGASGVNNKITGVANLTLDGDFVFDLSGAGINLGDSWNIVDVGTLSETFGSTFSVLGFTDNLDNTWTKINAGTTYRFSETTGVLTVVPEPSTWALLAVSGMTLLFLRQRRKTCYSA
ncbi:MAG: hypothetical protein BGO12_09685 [Verrucomicrobia bacterium 61-8]|nr:PEP-CTERM sorting domain-containing protein [Verrucomicrobiota bacterium]OJV25380.1 MAG: hypothetical protein BGO12_09685 [Verrucomicrobia bacterium 61-8]